jgi:glucose/arabinose dehydrogenase
MGGMPIRRLLVLALVALTPACGAEDSEPASSPRAQQAPALRIVRVAAGLSAPLHLVTLRSEPGRLYVVEQEGRIVVLENGRARATPFLDIRDRISSGGERGLLSVAFHPNYAQNRRFYVNFTDGNGDTRVVEMRSNGERALLETAREVLFVDQPYANHNGGLVVFGPDGKLYVGMGDGGAGGDPENRAQNLGTLLGKLVTINVDRPGAKPQIAASGLRNPWRFSFDRATGDLWIGDVGQSSWEEIDFTPRAQLPGLENYGWDVYEGRASFERKRPSRGTLVFPVHVYGRGQGCTVIGGFVYRGSAVPAARGRYFFGDLCEGTIWSLRRVGGKVRQLRREPFRVPSLASFGEDASGELYLVSLEGAVFRLAS